MSTNIDKVTSKDSFLYIFTVLTNDKEYSFAADAFDGVYKFKLHMEISTGISESIVLQDLNIYTYEDLLYLNSNRMLDAQLSIYNIKGQEIMHHNIWINGLNQIQLEINAGWHLIKVITNEGISSKKVFIK